MMKNMDVSLPAKCDHKQMQQFKSELRWMEVGHVVREQQK